MIRNQCFIYGVFTAVAGVALLGKTCAAHTIPSVGDPALDRLSNGSVTLGLLALAGTGIFHLLRWLVAYYGKRRAYDERVAQGGILVATALAVVLFGRIALSPPVASAHPARHTDTPRHGGQILAVGDNHLELVTTPDGHITLYLMGVTEALPYPISEKTLRGQAHGAGADEFPIVMQATPQVGDLAGQASVFVGRIPPETAGGPLRLTVSVPLAGARRQVAFGDGTQTHDTTATRVVAAPVTPAERALFLTPGGAYTNADIAANGGQTPEQKFQGLMANHHLHPKKGDIICPITRTQANPKFPWVVGGKTFLFCCPPCVTEFVRQAKARPGDLHTPQEYVQR